MKFSELAIRRPVMAIVLNIVILFFGVLGYSFLGIREYPAIDPPNITVRTSYTGANADIVESQITEPLEKSINGIQGVKTISSSSALGSSTITVEFELSADLEQAANDVRDKVAQAQRNLPQDIDAPPVVSKADASGDPIIFMTVESSRKNIVELSQYAENVLQEKLQSIPGVSQVMIYGLKRPAMRLWIEPAKLAAYGLTVQDVLSALNRENVELPGGKIRGDATELQVKTFGRLQEEKDFNDLIIRQTENQIIRFSDIGNAGLGAEIEETSARRNNVFNVSLALIPQPGSNYIEISEEFYRRFDAIQKELPPDVIIDIGIDKADFVRTAISEVEETLLIALVLVVLIVYAFFRNWSIALRPLIDIPVSLIGAFFIMYVFGFSVNILTLLAIVLATGLVVDDGIVVTENIYKKMESGMDKWNAVRYGMQEIFFAVISTSVTLSVVFIPVIFLEGFTGRLFREFGIVLAGAVLISAFVSLTLTPVLNLKLARVGAKPSRFYVASEPFFRGMENGYRRLLTAFLKRPYLAPLIVFICLAAGAFFFSLLKSELAPLEDRSAIRAPVVLPEGTDYDYTDRFISDASQVLVDSIPEAKMIFGIASPSFNGAGASNSGFLIVRLKKPSERVATQQEIYDRMNRIFRRMPEARIFPNQEQTISTSLAAGSQLPVQFVLQNLNFSKLETQLPLFLEEARKDPTFGNVDANLKFNKPELQITIDRLRASELGVSVLDISNTLQLALSGRRFGYFLMAGKQYQVIGQVEREYRDEPVDLSAFYVRNYRGELIRLDNLVNMAETSSTPSIFHYNRYKSATVSASLAPGKTLGDGIDAMEKIAGKVLDDSFETDLSGPSRDFSEGASNILFAFLLALVLIYLILAAQFESFRDPFIILFTVPLALAGAVLSLWLFGQTLNIFSEIGMIMLIGLVTKNGILIVEFANQKREGGEAKKAAVLNASVARLRPILMTSLATMLGALPIALALGAGAQSRVPLGIVIVGGLLFSLLLSLFVIPAMYTFIAARKKNHLPPGFLEEKTNQLHEHA
ncbi:MAG: efflux RND transporter permease subunit [Crocinitomicaceae bacterium]|nr:efflux RND transporter permease subunit [Crocinitomicaceae bacterium]